jgi:hypothetical protein
LLVWVIVEISGRLRKGRVADNGDPDGAVQGRCGRLALSWSGFLAIVSVCASRQTDGPTVMIDQQIDSPAMEVPGIREERRDMALCRNLVS